MSDTHLADDMTDAERNFFQSRGDVSDALVNENPDTPVSPDEPGDRPPQPAPGAGQAAPPAQGAPGAGDEDEDDEVDQAAQAGQQQPGQQQPRRVNYNKFRRTEERAVAAERALQEQAVRNAKVEERLNLLMEALNGPAQEAAQQQQEQQDPKPDKNKDIFAYSDWLERQVVRLGDRLDGFDNMVQTGQTEMNLQNQYFEDMNSFAAKEPHFVAAYAHLFRSRDAELAYYHPEMSRQQRNNIIIEEERALYKSAFDGRRSAAEMIFNLAKVRGFAPPAAQQQQQQGNGQQQPGQAAGGAQRTGGTPLGGVPAQGQQRPGNGTTQVIPQPQTAAQLVEAIKKGQGASLSLSQGAGGTGIELTPQMLGDMDDDAFEAVYEEVKARGKGREREFFGS